GVFSRGRTMECPRSTPAVTRAALSLKGGRPRFLDVNGPDLRLYTLPAVFDGKRLGTVVAGVSLAPYEQTRRTALIGSIGLAVLLLLVVAVAARWVLAAAFRPVARMTEAAADWSDRRLDPRYARRSRATAGWSCPRDGRRLRSRGEGSRSLRGCCHRARPRARGRTAAIAAADRGRARTGGSNPSAGRRERRSLQPGTRAAVNGAKLNEGRLPH